MTDKQANEDPYHMNAVRIMKAAKDFVRVGTYMESGLGGINPRLSPELSRLKNAIMRLEDLINESRND